MRLHEDEFQWPKLVVCEDPLDRESMHTVEGDGFVYRRRNGVLEPVGDGFGGGE